MYALIEIAGKQFKLEENSQVEIPYNANKVGDKINFDKVFCYNKVVDWFDVRSGGGEELVFNIPQDSVIQSIESYPSSRRDGQIHYDLYSVSHLSDSQLISYEYSDTYIRFMVQKYVRDKKINPITPPPITTPEPKRCKVSRMDTSILNP